jgi:ribosomal protein L12E/L44/L45/RPP1/RPP2
MMFVWLYLNLIFAVLVSVCKIVCSFAVQDPSKFAVAAPAAAAASGGGAAAAPKEEEKKDEPEEESDGEMGFSLFDD